MLATIRNQKLSRLLFGAAALTAIAVMSGCLEGSAVRTGPYLPAKPAYAHIDVYMDEAVPFAWGEVGHLNAKGTGHNADLNDVIAVMKDQARGLGADGIIVTDTWYEDETWYDSYGYAHVRERMYASAIAIYYL